MKRNFKERIEDARRAFFEDNEEIPPGQLVVREGTFTLQNMVGEVSEHNSKDWWSFAKYFLFFLPGVSLLFFVTLVMTHFLVFQNQNIKNFSFSFFWLTLGAFMTMFGIGKLADLKYLKVVGSVMAATFLIALSFFFVPDELKGKFFGSYSLFFLPIAWAVGFVTKRWIDSEE